MSSEKTTTEKTDLGIPAEKMPRHVAIIVDGNRRFAKRINLDPWKGHDYGKDKIEKLLDWCKELGVKELTIYAFSMQNFKRSKQEIDYLIIMFKKICEDLLKNERVQSEGVRIRFLGRIELFGEEIEGLMRQIMEKTKNNSTYKLNLAMAYGGREEITDAVRKIAEKVKAGELSPENITEDTIKDNLYMADEPDLIIRTSGELRTSNFLPWQSTYSEWFFLEKTWPEFEKEDLAKCIIDFSKRERRHGK
jgi:tritrans,polycis-undecaprenyl-diphosphate synthase [geranylgeranyl-diphosphate specific]